VASPNILVALMARLRQKRLRWGLEGRTSEGPPMPTTLLDFDDPNSLDIVCDVILADWFNAGIDTFDIRDFRGELEQYYIEAGRPVPAEIADPTKLVPTLRLLQARMHIVKPTRITGIEWQFLRNGDPIKRNGRNF
jgi:hypothetical protein